MTPRRAAALVLTLTALVPACRAEGTTAVRFDREGRAKVVTSLELAGEARDALRRSPELAARVEAAARRRFPDLRRADGGRTLRWTAVVDPDQVAAASGVLGVSRLEVHEGGSPSVAADLVVPQELEDAVREGLAGPEAAAAVPAFLENTWVGIEVEFPGPVTSATTTGPRLRRTDRSVRVRQPLAAYRTGTVTAAGRTSDGAPLRNAVLVVAALGAMAALAVVLRRRPAGDPS